MKIGAFDRGLGMAGLIISAIPMIVLFLLTQRQFIRGLAAGGIKG